MRKLILIAFAVLMLVAFGACGAQSASADPDEMSSADASAGDDDELVRADIGFCLKGDSAFDAQLATEIEAACAALGYTPAIKTAKTANQQKSDISSLLALGAQVIVIDPVNVDALEAELAECETSGVKVIDILDSINGTVSTLISPDYIQIGKSAGNRAVALYGEGGKCLLLKTGYDSFTMQLMSDGFLTAIAADDDVVLAADAYCGLDEEKAYEAVKSAIATHAINFVFAQSSELGRGAIRAIEESRQAVSLVVFGGDADIIEAVSAGKVDTVLFIDPAQVISKVMADAAGIIRDGAYAPAQYQQLDVYTVNTDNAAQYLPQGALYAKAPAQ